MSNIALVLDLSARRVPNDTAVVFGEERWCYRDLHALANRIANGLNAAGIDKGDKVALSCPNRPEFIAAYFGILKTGAVVVPLSTMLKRPEVAHQIAGSDAKALICHDGPNFAEHVRPGFADVPACASMWIIDDEAGAQDRAGGEARFSDLIAGQLDRHETVPVASEDTASINYTSGTTGEAKGVEVSHGNLLYQVVLNQGLADRGMSRSRLVVLPLYHVFSQVLAVNLGLFSGEKLVLMPQFDPGTALALIRREKVNHVAGIPAVFQALLSVEGIGESERREISDCLRLAPCGGAAMPAGLSEAFAERFGIPIRQGYGLTETTSVVTWNAPNAPIVPGSVGPAVPGVSIRVTDGCGTAVKAGQAGRIFVRSAGLMTGYYKDPQSSHDVLTDGWLDTGDVGALDEDGYLFLFGRSDDLIIRGSTKVYPAEIEPILERHPAVAQAVVVGVPDPQLGQEVKAVIVLREGEPATENELLDWVKSRISDEKYPRLIELRTSLPMTGTQKVQRKLLV